MKEYTDGGIWIYTTDSGEVWTYTTDLIHTWPFSAEYAHITCDRCDMSYLEPEFRKQTGMIVNNKLKYYGAPLYYSNAKGQPYYDENVKSSFCGAECVHLVKYGELGKAFSSSRKGKIYKTERNK